MQPLESPSYQGQAVRLCTDGKYRWTYPMNMLKNPSVYLTVCKIFGAIGGVAFFVAYISDVVVGDFTSMINDLPYWGIAILVFIAISLLAYLIVAAQYGYKYIVSFTMDESGIIHEQVAAQKKVARKIGGMLASGGALAASPGRVGQGMLIANHTSLSSDFSKGRSIKPLRRWHTIKVNESLAKNQVYTAPEDFDFVLSYIRSHCPKAK